ncbi:MAG: LysM peptidoglycan-binding domain-containing protein [Clostridia bacterium]
MLIHVIRPGETLWGISQIYGVPLEQILRENEVENPSLIMPGQSIVISQGLQTHMVRPGENLWLIAQQYRTTVTALVQVNNIQNPSLIYPGQQLKIPSVSKRLGALEVNGYIEPTGRGNEINLLRGITSYLTYLSIFSYRVKADGTLIPVNDVDLIRTARENKIAPLMVLTNFAQGTFSTELAHIILSNPSIQSTLIEHIVTTLSSKNYYGINVDFERVSPEDKELYNSFLEKLKMRLKNTGHIITTALAPKHSADLTGPWYTAHDYPVHGNIVDFTMPMTYEWGWSGGPPMPVAPLNQVKSVLDYALSVIPAHKIMMGMPLYGYDWILPYVRGGPYAKTLSPKAAVELAQNAKTVIHYDTISQSPYFNYFDSNEKEHIVWFEDARSVLAKYELIHHLGLRGVSYWVLGRSFPQNWAVLDELFSIKKII